MSKTIYNSELFWLNHPSPYVSMYMKYDWFQMDRIKFMCLYIKEYSTSKLEEKKDAIKGVLNPIWFDMPTSEKYIVLSMLTEKKHHADSFHDMLLVHEIFDCDFLDNAIKTVYNITTGFNYDTNLLTCYGINPAKL